MFEVVFETFDGLEVYYFTFFDSAIDFVSKTISCEVYGIQIRRRNEVGDYFALLSSDSSDS